MKKNGNFVIKAVFFFVTVFLFGAMMPRVTHADVDATLIVIKQVINDNGGDAFAGNFVLHVKQGASEVSGSPAPGSEPGTAYSLQPGTYVVSEDAPTDYEQVGFSGDCDFSGSVTIPANQTRTCTITNNDIAPILILDKNVNNSGGGGAPENAWNLVASGPTTIAGSGYVQSGPNFSAGTYTLSEAGPPRYSAGSWSCVGGLQNGNLITIALNEAVICSITNTFINSPPTASNLSVLSDVCPFAPGTGLATFSWNYGDSDGDSQKKFQLQIDDNAGFGSPAIDWTIDNLNNPSGTLNQQGASIMVGGNEIDDLLYNKTYFWRVKVWESNPLGGGLNLDSGWVVGPDYQTIAHPGPYTDFTFFINSPDVSFFDNAICYDNNGLAACQSWNWDFDYDNVSFSIDSILQDPPIQTYTVPVFSVALAVSDLQGNSCTEIKPFNLPSQTVKHLWLEENSFSSFYDFPDYLLPPSPQCSDGVGNDSDGFTDFPADPGCTDAYDNDETNMCFLLGQPCPYDPWCCSPYTCNQGICS